MMQLTAAQDGNLLDLLRELGPDSSKTTLRSWVAQGRVSVDGKQVTDTRVQVKQGQEVKVGSKCLFARENIKILFEDAHIVVILKPEGLLTVATDFDQEFTAHTVLKNRHEGQVYPVHRLDRETSGVMVFAYTEAARDKLKEVFYTHDIEREYLALVEGRPTPDKGTWESTLIEQADYSVRSAPGGKLAITHYEVLKQKGQFTLLRLKLQTGRKNQIRVHCKEAGFPITGDKKYGAKTHAFGRLCLHAQKLAFLHPITKKPLSFESPVPEMFHAAK
ncbi:MAG TPA: RluA family pseudouridine synthase [Rhabdochlamydiaceae bacterium]